LTPLPSFSDVIISRLNFYISLALSALGPRFHKPASIRNDFERAREGPELSRDVESDRRAIEELGELSK
jgi:hypothetical protein